MQYRKNKKGEDVSLLGYGCMRFSTKAGRIDLDKAEKEILAALNAGVNYFDTAYIYPGNEAALGEIVERNGIREKINIATKLPQYLISNNAGLEKFFKEELSRLRTNYVDYYLMHHLTDFSQWEKLKALGIEDWIAQKKASGEIRNIGFSFHGTTEMFKKILDDYDWDSCLVQYNYLDKVSQAGEAGVKAAAAKGIPVMIMEPLRGGKLVNLLPETAKKMVASNPHGWSAAEWGFRWLFNQSEVTCVLSGMNSIEMVQENCRIASEASAGHFSDEDFAFIDKLIAEIKRTEKVGCTGCRYCMPCPRGIDIPGIFRGWNLMYSESKIDGRRDYFQSTALRKDSAFATACIGCGKCEKHCPQNIQIREMLKKADKELCPWYMKPAISVAKKFMLRGKSK
ncbi:MAG: aldo/keto reductase [Spirochaetales bacterium]|nr:aldo/keto reductase [Spirochaetales bacterium]